MATTTAVRNRYAGAVNARSLIVDDRTTMSDSDVLAAMGFADRALTTGKRWMRVRPGETPRQEPVRPAPLAASMARLFAGDNRAAHEIVKTMADMAFERSFVLRVKLPRERAHDMACMCLAFARNGTCRTCGGHGKTLIPGSPIHSQHDCQACRGLGKVPFEPQFRFEHRDLARWLLDELEREAALAFPEAARSLATDMDL